MIPAGETLSTDHPILHEAVAMRPRIEAARSEIEEGRRLPPVLAAAMKEAGIFGMAMPRAWGGPELDLMTQSRVIEALAMADGSVGWCAMINCDGGYLSAFLSEDAGRAAYPDIWSATAAVLSVYGIASQVSGGYRVSGRFRFASGCRHSKVAWLGCKVSKDGELLRNLEGAPIIQQCLVPMSNCEILDSWNTMGLRGTGSHDLLVEDVFVKDELTFSFDNPFLIKRTGPLYALPRMYALKGPAVALGVARCAINALIKIASKKPSRPAKIDGHLESSQALRDEVFVQDAVGRSETLLMAARAYHFETVGDLWATLIENRQPSAAQLAHIGTAFTFIVGAAVEVVQTMYKVAGGSAAYQDGIIERCLRDVLTMNQHAGASLRSYESAGRRMLGLSPLRWLR